MAALIALGGAAFVLLAAAGALLWQLLATIRSIEPHDSAPTTYAYDDAWISEAFKDLALAVGEGIEKVERNERRVRTSINAAKRRFDAAGFEDPFVDGEVEALQEDDERRGEEEGVPVLPEGVGEPVRQPSIYDVIPGDWGPEREA